MMHYFFVFFRSGFENSLTRRVRVRIYLQRVTYNVPVVVRYLKQLYNGVTFYSPAFLPDPKDGTLYALNAELEGLKKLPFTIPELVQASPCKSSDGTLYTGNAITILRLPVL